MLDPRIYRTGMVFVLFAAILVAFSLSNQQPAATTTNVPDAFSGATAYTSMQTLAAGMPIRTAGSEGDDALASSVARAMRDYGYAVTEPTDRVQTPAGVRTVVSVLATRAGQIPDNVVVVAPRDSTASPAVDSLSGTAVLIELARVLSGSTQHHGIVLASISGSAGGAGATRLASTLESMGPVDAVISLGDLDSRDARGPVVHAYSDGVAFAPTRLRNTVSSALAAEGAPHSDELSLAGQLAHLSLPASTTPEAPFNARGVPAVTISLSGARAGSGEERLAGPGRMAAIGRGVVRAVDAIDGDTQQPPPAPYLVIRGKLLPDWAFRLLVLAALLPVAAVAIDGAARASRRGWPLGRWLLALAVRALPPAAAVAAVVLAQAVGILHAPPGLLGPAESTSTTAEVLVLLVAGLFGLGLLAAVRLVVPLPQPRVRRGADAPGGTRGWRNPGAAAATLLLLCAALVAVWFQNPFACAIMVPALHLWMWNMDPDLGVPRLVRAVIFALGLLPPALIILDLARETGLNPGQVVWSGLLLIAGGGVRFTTLMEWCVLLTGTVAAGACVLGRLPATEISEAGSPGSVRGPAGYAGPGSLGGTESALRR